MAPSPAGSLPEITSSHTVPSHWTTGGRDRPTISEQLPLAATIADAHRAGGDRLRALLRLAVERNRLVVVDLAEECGVDARQLGRALRDEGGAHPPLAFVACLLARDRERVILHGLADLLGYEATPKRQDLASENRQLRSALLAVRAEIDALLGGGP